MVIEEKRWGATPDEWLTFDMMLGLTRDMLPAVANPGAAISPSSKLSTLGKTPSVYNRKGYAVGIPEWTTHEATQVEVDGWSENPDYSICLIGREMKAIDGDITDELLARRVRDFIGDRLPPMAQMRYRNNSPKFLFMFRLPAEMMKRVIRTEHGVIEFLGDRQQFLVAGTHTSGARYEWENLDAPVVEMTIAQFDVLWTSLEKEFGIEPSVTAKAPKQATDDPVLAALHERGLVLSHDRDGQVNITCPFTAEHTGESAESSTSYWPAHTGGYAHSSIKCLHAHCAQRSTPDFLAAIGFDGSEDFEDITNDAPHAPTATTDALRFPIKTSHEFARCGVATTWFIKKVIPHADLGVVYGASGTGKTFLMFDLAACIALGIPWRGNKVKQGNVLYICAEGAQFFRNRILAYEKHFNVENIPVHVMEGGANFLKSADVNDVISAIKAWGNISVIIVDTYSRIMPGGDENSGVDAGRVVANCARITRETGAMIILVHHSGKDASKGARGHSSLRAAADFELEVIRNGDARSVTCSKMKDGEDGLEYGFKLILVPVGNDEDGDVVTSCVLGHVNEVPMKGAPKKEKMGANMKIILGCVQDYYNDHNEWPTVAELIIAAKELEVSSSNAHRAKDTLIDKGFLEEDKGFVRLPAEGG